MISYFRYLISLSLSLFQSSFNQKSLKIFLFIGHCTEFNEVGGVIQDQLLSKCNGVFPKCDDYYFSSDAYKCEVFVSVVRIKVVLNSF